MRHPRQDMTDWLCSYEARVPRASASTRRGSVEQKYETTTMVATSLTVSLEGGYGMYMLRETRRATECQGQEQRTVAVATGSDICLHDNAVAGMVNAIRES